MTRAKAVEKIMNDLGLTNDLEDYVYRTIGMLGCGDTLDRETVKGVKEVIKREEEYHRLNGRTFYYTKEMPSGISLGNYIIMSREDYGDGMRHEYGHSVQSRILGPLYLLLIGLPSLLWNIIDRVAVKPLVGRVRSCEIYFAMPWEHWADVLGGEDRAAYMEKYKDYYRWEK